MQLISTPKHIGAILVSRRKHLKLSQTEVASRLDLSQNRLSELESRPETLTVAQLLALLNVLELEVFVRVRDPSRKPKVEW